MASKADREYITTESGDKDFYYKKLQDCYIGYSPKQSYGGWSVATTDGMMNGIPYLMYEADYYRELWDKGVFVKNDDELLEKLNFYLDNEYNRNVLADESLQHIRYRLIFKDEVKQMSDYIDELHDTLPKVKNSEKIKEIISWIQKEKRVSKSEIMKRLGWGVGIKWTQYRATLLTHPNIYDILSKDPVYCWID